MALKVQLAIQGGGAKLIALLAAMEGVQELHKSGAIQVTRIAGTSAGSIVGAMFAADLDLRSIREKLQEIARGQIQQLFRPPSKSKFFTRVLLRGKPLWDEREVRRILTPYFKQKGVRTMKELQAKQGIPVHILSSLLSQTRKHVRHSESENDREHDVVSALLDSCGLPYCFRVWQEAGDLIVDGGICENLPSDELLPFEKTDGPVVGVSFDPAWPDTPRTAAEFSLALLDTAVSNSVHRAKARLGERVLVVKTRLTTFDFPEAGRFSDEAAELTKRQAKDFFQDFIARQSGPVPGLPGDPWTSLPVDELTKWWRIFRAQHKPGGARTSTVSLVVQVNSLLDDQSHPLAKLPDIVTYIIEFTAADRIYCSHLSLASEKDDDVVLEKTRVTLRDANNEDIPFELVPARDPEMPFLRPAILFFNPPLEAGTGPYTLTCRQYVERYLGDIKTKRHADLSLNAVRSMQGGELNIVVQTPIGYTGARVVGKKGTPGEPMSHAEARKHHLEGGFDATGWKAQRVPTGGEIVCDVLL